MRWNTHSVNTFVKCKPKDIPLVLMCTIYVPANNAWNVRVSYDYNNNTI